MCLLWPVGDVGKDGKYKGDSVSTLQWPVCDISKDGKYKGDSVSTVLWPVRDISKDGKYKGGRVSALCCSLCVTSVRMVSTRGAGCLLSAVVCV